MDMFDAPPHFDGQDGLFGKPGADMSLISSVISLADLPRGVDANVIGVIQPTVEEDRELVLRLIEIGFIPGESVRIVACGMPGREPLAVRMGNTTFALRRFEAQYVQVVAQGAGVTG
jgi:ferrous iron transport protein A